jgi:hypothetical protein
MPIKQGGMLANRAFTWPRDHFCRSPGNRSRLQNANENAREIDSGTALLQLTADQRQKLPP